MHSADSVLILGTGALACLFAARIAASGKQVIMLGSWPEGLQAIRENGVRLVDLQGQERAYPVQATDCWQDCIEERFALVLVKSWQTGRAAEQLSRCLAQSGLALSLQNGMGNHETLARRLGAERVALGITTLGATLLAPGRVRQAGTGVISLSPSVKLAPLADWLKAAGFSVEYVPDTDALLWSKLVINAAINPLTALLNVPNGELLARKTARALLRATAQETASVAGALSVQLPYADPAAAAESVAQRTASNRSSMLQDVLRGAPTEIDSICGAIVRAGERAGVPTPINHTLWLLVQALQPQRP